MLILIHQLHKFHHNPFEHSDFHCSVKTSTSTILFLTVTVELFASQDRRDYEFRLRDLQDREMDRQMLGRERMEREWWDWPQQYDRG